MKVSQNLQPKKIGSYRFYDFCRFCFSKKTISILNLGNLPLAGGFLTDLSKNTLEQEKYYPLELMFCKDCFLVQTNTVIDADTLFKKYFYFSSKIQTLVNHFQHIANSLPELKTKKNKKFIVEIGCNDGTFIKAIKEKGYDVLGVDPATNVVTPLIKKGLPIINDYFSKTLATEITKKYGKADAIYSFNTLAHIENMHDIFSGIETLLKNDGYLTFETHYLGSLLKQLQYDMIYHEHQYYYSLLAIENFLKMHDMHVFHAELIPTHAGSIRFFVQKNVGKRKKEVSVEKLREKEKKQKLQMYSSYKRFSSKIERAKKNLIVLLTDLKKQKKTIVGYGASGRGTIISNYCELDSSLINFVVDDSPIKQHIYMPGTHVPTITSDIFYENSKPDYAILFAWSFAEEIKKKHKKYLETGGKFILPLPKVQLVKK